MNTPDIAAIIGERIEKPAFDQVQRLIRTGQMTPADAALFRSSAQAYKSALSSRYAGFDPRVRDALLAALLKDYAREIERLLAGVQRRPMCSATDAYERPSPAEPTREPTPSAPQHQPPRVAGRSQQPAVNSNTPVAANSVATGDRDRGGPTSKVRSTWRAAKRLITGSGNSELGNIAAVMDQEVNENGFSFFFNYEHYPPIGGRGGEQYEVFVTRYYDRTKGDGAVRLHDNVIDGPFKARGKTLREALAKSADAARQWANDQPADRT